MDISRGNRRVQRLLIANIAIFAVLFLFVAAYSISAIAQRRIAVRAQEIRSRYEEIQKRTVQSEVDRAVSRIDSFKSFIAEDGVAVPDALFRRRILDLFSAERFGVGFDGYFFVADSSGVLLANPAFPELVGKSLYGLDAGNGENLGTLFGHALAGSSEGSFVSYLWASRSGASEEMKTSYIRRYGPWGWTVGSGYYLREFDALVERESAAVIAGIRSTMNRQLALLALAAGIALSLGGYLAVRVFRLEKLDARHVLELEQYKRLLDESALVSRTTPAGIITYVNDRFCEATGYTRAEVIGKPHSVERHPSTPKETFKNLWDTIKAGNVWHGVIKNRRADGSSYYKSATILPVTDESGAVSEYIAAGQDITELVEQRGKLSRAFHTDPLTGLGSRIKLLEDIERAEAPAVALLDISDFSRINDAYGEEAGNAVLVEFASRMHEAAGLDSLSSYRIYADTFAFLSGNTTSFELIKRLKRIRERVVGEPFVISGDQLPLNLRIGVACGDKDVLAYADLALGAARSRGVDLFSYGAEDDSISQDLMKSVDSLKRIHAALRSDRIYPVFQPIQDTRTGKIVKYECLMRASDEDGKVMSPDDFIPVSKKTRLYPSLTRVVVEKSIRAFRDTPFEFAVNLTLEDLFNGATIDYLIEAAADAESIGRLVVEIVETEELVGFDEPFLALKRLKSAGAKIAIDDFGAGYSNFAYLLKLDPDYIKIDGSIIAKISVDERAEGLARSIVQFASSSGIKTIAEFVSDAAIAEAVAEIGVDFLQGYWVGKPVATLPAAD